LPMTGATVALVYQTTQSRQVRQDVLTWFRTRGIPVADEMTLCPEVAAKAGRDGFARGALQRRSGAGRPDKCQYGRLVTVARMLARAFTLSRMRGDVLGSWFDCSAIVGIVSGTSCPESVITEVLSALRRRCPDISIEEDA